MKVRLSGITVQDQTKALAFYTDVLGFVKKQDIPMGPEFRWLTVVSPEDPDGAELCLEPLGFGPSVIYQKALFDAGIPANAFAVSDVAAEHARLEALGVDFRQGPTDAGTTRLAVFADTCGNLIQIYEEPQEKEAG